ncbi:MAG: zf-HC2 domain-containing protein [Bryobacterales bacterium]|nr:zf-HC2 domain-containing protein [Bryobacterales bacterium]
MTCSDLELVLCDYIDGTLSANDRTAVAAHLAACPACAELAADAGAAVRFMERAAVVEPPQALVTRILQQVPAKAPVTERARGAFARLFGRVFEPVLQPRMVMGMAMTILSFAMLGRFAGIEARQLRASDLDPVKIVEATEDRIHRTWVRAVKYYESLRFVYEIQSRLRELTDSEEESAAAQDADQSPKAGTPADQPSKTETERK